MITRKVAMVGHWGVGKTSLVRQYVSQQFSESYLATLGVKIDKKQVECQGQMVNMVLWDIAGAEDTFDIPMHYIKGAAGYLLVIDGTRPETLEAAKEIAASIEKAVPGLPFSVAINKNDLETQLTDDAIAASGLSDSWIRTSAKTGEGVEDLFLHIAGKLLDA